MKRSDIFAMATLIIYLGIILIPLNTFAGGKNVDNPANSPFAKTLCRSTVASECDASATQPALTASFVVPSATSAGEPVKRLVIEFVSGTCVGSGRATFVRILGTPSGSLANPDTGDNFSDNFFPLAVAQFIGPAAVNGVQSFAQSTRIYLDPGMTVTMSSNTAEAGTLHCRAHLNGYFVKD